MLSMYFCRVVTLSDFLMKAARNLDLSYLEELHMQPSKIQLRNSLFEINKSKKGDRRDIGKIHVTWQYFKASGP